MTRFTTFTDDELNTMESAFRFNDKGLTALAVEIRAERRCREKSETEKYKALHDKMEQLAMNSNYGVVTKSCEDDLIMRLDRLKKKISIMDQGEAGRSLHDQQDS